MNEYNIDEEFMNSLDEFLSNSNEIIQKAAHEMMMLVFDITSNINTPYELSNEVVQKRKQEIYKDLTPEEIEKIEKFGLDYIDYIEKNRIDNEKLKR